MFEAHFFLDTMYRFVSISNRPVLVKHDKKYQKTYKDRNRQNTTSENTNHNGQIKVKTTTCILYH